MTPLKRLLDILWPLVKGTRPDLRSLTTALEAIEDASLLQQALEELGPSVGVELRPIEDRIAYLRRQAPAGSQSTIDSPPEGKGRRSGDVTKREASEVLADAFDDAGKIRSDSGWQALGQEALIERHLDDLRPSLWEHRKLLALIPQEFCDMREALDLDWYRRRIEAQCPELRGSHGKPVRFVWRAEQKEKDGKIILASCKVFPKRERQLWDEVERGGPCPWWEIEIGLAGWILATEHERLHVLHHELMHCDVKVSDVGEEKPAIRAHDIQEFTATVGRFGPLTTADSSFAENLTRHPRHQEHRAREGHRWQVDVAGQGLLFTPFLENR